MLFDWHRRDTVTLHHCVFVANLYWNSIVKRSDVKYTWISGSYSMGSSEVLALSLAVAAAGQKSHARAWIKSR